MSRIALRSLRVRWATLTGAFVALAFGVALMVVMLLGLAAAARMPTGQTKVALLAVLGTAAGVNIFVAAFVVASTYSYVVALRQRELGLLRLAGATRGQVRTTVVVEALMLAVVASGVGCAVGRVGGPVLGRWLIDMDLAPSDFVVGQEVWPLHVAFWTGLLVAVCGVAAAARRAGRVGPLDALHEADFEVRVMTGGRWFWGLGLLATAVILIATSLVSDPGGLLSRKTYTVQPMVLICACGLLAPILARPLVRLLMWLPARITLYAGVLVRENASAGMRRTGAIAAPVLVSVALAGSLIGAVMTVSTAKASEASTQMTADYVIFPTEEGLVEKLRELPGVVVSATATTTLSLMEGDGALVESSASAVDPQTISAVVNLPTLAGQVSDLDESGIIVTEEWQLAVGDSVKVVRADSSQVTLRVVAVLSDGTGNNGLYVTAHNAPNARVDRIDLKVKPGSENMLQAIAKTEGVTMTTRADWLARNTSPITFQRMALVLGVAMTYLLIALVNILVMATSNRGRELALLRLAGATRFQAVRLVTVESLVVVAVGALLGCLVAAIQLGVLRLALELLGVSSPLVVPWQAIGFAAGICALVTLPSAVISAMWATRPTG